MILLIDIGNSRLKWVTASGGILGRSEAIAHTLDLDSKRLDAAWGTLPQPESVYLSSVASSSINSVVFRWIGRRWGSVIEQLAGQAYCDEVKNGYTQPEQLGIDRWAAIVGAYKLCGHACCVVDCGTAMTCDAVASNGMHLGGWITPGRYLQEQLLLRSTAGLNTRGAADDASMWGKETSTCISVGTLQAQLALVERCRQQLMLHEGKAVSVILTGGEATGLLEHLAFPVCYEPDLVFKGMLCITGHYGEQDR